MDVNLLVWLCHCHPLAFLYCVKMANFAAILGKGLQQFSCPATESTCPNQQSICFSWPLNIQVFEMGCGTRDCPTRFCSVLISVFEQYVYMYCDCCSTDRGKYELIRAVYIDIKHGVCHRLKKWRRDMSDGPSPGDRPVPLASENPRLCPNVSTTTAK